MSVSGHRDDARHINAVPQGAPRVHRIARTERHRDTRRVDAQARAVAQHREAIEERAAEADRRDARAASSACDSDINEAERVVTHLDEGQGEHQGY